MHAGTAGDKFWPMKGVELLNEKFLPMQRHALPFHVHRPSQLDCELSDHEDEGNIPEGGTPTR